MALDIQTIRQDFPILGKTVYNKPLIYLDNGATTQKPRCVVEKMVFNYYNENANIHRGVHFLSQAATEAHEEARQAVQHFLNARSSNEIIFTRGTTESINLIASSFTDECMSVGDEVIVSVMEHHSNIVPWQIQAARRGSHTHNQGGGVLLGLLRHVHVFCCHEATPSWPAPGRRYFSMSVKIPSSITSRVTCRRREAVRFSRGY